jgi:hypothetical protein
MSGNHQFEADPFYLCIRIKTNAANKKFLRQAYDEKQTK